MAKDTRHQERAAALLDDPGANGAQDLAERAAALLDLPSAKGSPDFAVRAAACYLLTHCKRLDGFDVLRVWPGRMPDFTPFSREADIAFAEAIIAAARKR